MLHETKDNTNTTLDSINENLANTSISTKHSIQINKIDAENSANTQVHYDQEETNKLINNFYNNKNFKKMMKMQHPKTNKFNDLTKKCKYLERTLAKESQKCEILEVENKSALRLKEFQAEEINLLRTKLKEMQKRINQYDNELIIKDQQIKDLKDTNEKLNYQLQQNFSHSRRTPSRSTNHN